MSLVSPANADLSDSTAVRTRELSAPSGFERNLQRDHTSGFLFELVFMRLYVFINLLGYFNGAVADDPVWNGYVKMLAKFFLSAVSLSRIQAG